MQDPMSGQTVRQCHQPDDGREHEGHQSAVRSARGRASSAREPVGAAPASPAPLLLNAKQSAQFLGVCERTFHTLRGESWMPDPVEIRPGMPRWLKSELEVALAPERPLPS